MSLAHSPVKNPIKYYPTALLDFDPENPRFNIAYSSAKQDDLDSTVNRMIREEHVQELMGSIGEQGFFPGEPLLICPKNDGSGHYIVVEGNRRLTALKLLNGEFDHPKLLPSVFKYRDEAKIKPKEVACIEFEHRKDILRYLGYRHITGAKRWDPLAKARYLSQLRAEYYNDLDEETQLKWLAKDIGSRSDYVGQMLASLAVYERAKENNFYGLQYVREEDVEFSLLTTALSYKNISDYIGLKSKTDTLAESLDEGKCRELLSWCFAQNPESGETVLEESRNLKKLAAIVDPENVEALEELRRSHSISIAFQKTEAPSAAFSELLRTAFSALRSANDQFALLDRTDESHYKSIQQISDIADQIGFSISQKLRRQRIHTESDRIDESLDLQKESGNKKVE